MTIEIGIILALILLATFLFITEKVSFDLTALLITSTLMVTGILTVQEGLSGFSNPATITIASMFVLSEGVRRTGALNIVSDFFCSLGEENYYYTLVVMMLVIGIISAFINNTAAVAIFIPVVVGVAREMKASPSKMLMPLSFASMFGGVCTLIGTSTNILVSSIAQDYGGAPLGMFELAPLGVILFVVGFIYLFTIGIPMIPERRTEEDLTANFEMNEFLTDVIIEPGFQSMGDSIEEAHITKDLDLDIIQVFRKSGELTGEGQKTSLRPGDTLRIRGSVEEIDKLIDREDLSLKPTKDWYDVDIERGNSRLVEAVVAPDSALEGKKIREVEFYERFGAVVLALRHGGKLQQEDLGEHLLSGGDSLLLSMGQERIEELKNNRSFVVVSQIGLPRYRESKMPVALSILAAIVLLTATGVMPVVINAGVGCILLMLTGCITSEEAYDAINWEVIMLLAGVLPLGLAMQKTGADQLMARFILEHLQSWGPTVLVSVFFLLSMLLTNLISNQATAAMLAPLALQTAQTMGVSGRPFLIAVTVAASLSFITPVGYQTNTLVYGPGQYKFTDFTKVGTPLNIIFWILASLLIPYFWPF